MNARTTDPETSHDAARRLTSCGRHGMLLLAQFANKSMTAEMAGRDAGLLGTGYWKRISDLKRLGYLTVRMDNKGLPLTWPTKSNRRALVLKITDEGRALLRQHKAEMKMRASVDA